MGHASKEVLGNNDKARTTKIQPLRIDIENSKLKEQGSMKDHFSKLMELVNQVKTLGEKPRIKECTKKSWLP